MTRMRAGADIAVSSLEMEMAMMRTLCGFLPFGSLMITLCVGLINAGCSQQDARDYYFENPHNIDSLNRGATASEVEELAGKRGAFEFLTGRNGDDISCIMYYLDAPRYRSGSQFTHPPFVRRLFVFRNDRLEKVCSLPQKGSVIETDEEGNRHRRVFPVDPHKRIDSVLGNTDILGTEYMVPKPLAGPHPSDRPRIPVWHPVGFSFAMATLIGGPISEIREAPKRKAIRRRSLLARKRYDPSTISIGDSRKTVERRFGTPIRCEQRGEYIFICVYGDPEISQERFAVAVRYESDAVVGVYCDEFFPTAWLPQE